MGFEGPPQVNPDEDVPKIMDEGSHDQQEDLEKAEFSQQIRGVDILYERNKEDLERKL